MSETKSSYSSADLMREIDELRAHNENLKRMLDEKTEAANLNSRKVVEEQDKHEWYYLRGEVDGLRFAIRCIGGEIMRDDE